MTRKLQLITVTLTIFLGLTTTTALADPVLHVIGVYEGKVPAGSDDKPWWAKCSGGKLEKMSGEDSDDEDGPSMKDVEECHKKFAHQQTEKEVTVKVNDDTRPVVLALTAYDKTLWKVSLKAGVKIEKVILAGYHSQRISGISAQTPIETYTYDPSPCDQCKAGSGKHFFSYEKPPKQLEKITGLEVTSFQGRYEGSVFSIVPGKNAAAVK